MTSYRSRSLPVLVLASVCLLGCSKDSPTGPPPPTGPGNIELTTIPASAAARLDGGTAVAYTNTQFNGVAAGTHQVSLSLLGYADTTIAVAVVPQAIASVTVALRPLAGTPTTITELWSGLFTSIGPLALGPTGTFYLTAGANNLTVLAVIASSGMIQRQTLISDPDARPSEDIALDSQSNAFVATASYHDVIYVFDHNGYFIRTISRRPNSDQGIAGIAIGPGDTVQVSARYGSGVIEKYTPAGTFVVALSTGLSQAGAIEVGADGSIYVGTGPNTSPPRILKFSRTGTPILSWSVPAWPHAITRGTGGNLYVTGQFGDGIPADTERAPSRMQVYTPGGTLLAQWAIENRSLGFLGRHAVAGDGTIYLPNRNDNLVLRYGFQ